MPCRKGVIKKHVLKVKVDEFSLTLPSKCFCSRNLIGWLDSVWTIKGKFNTEVEEGWPSVFSTYDFLFLQKLKKAQQTDFSPTFQPSKPSQNHRLKPVFILGEFTSEWFILEVFWMMISYRKLDFYF